MNRLTFGLKVVVCFFLFDALEKAIDIAGLAAAGVPFEREALADHWFPPVLAASFDLLLALQIGLRTRAGRFWGMIYLAAVTALRLYILVVEPRRWIELGMSGRAGEIATYALNTLFFAILAGRRSARILVR